MRRRFRDLRQILTIPTLHGVSAFGTRLSFYEYDSAAQTLDPPEIIRSSPRLLTDLAHGWDCDVLHPEGEEHCQSGEGNVCSGLNAKLSVSDSTR